MKKLLIIPFCIVLLSCFVFAENEISVTVEEVATEIEAGKEAIFLLTITNNQPDRDVFKIVGDELAIYPFSDFAQTISVEPAQIKLDSEESAVVKVTIKTLETVRVNKQYATKMKVSSLIDPAVKNELSLLTLIISPKELIRITPEVPSIIVPGEEVYVRFGLENRANFAVNNAELSVSSNLPQIQERVALQFEPKEKKTEEFLIKLDTTTHFGEYKLEVKIYQGTELKGSLEIPFNVESRKDVVQEKEIDRGFLSSTLKVINDNTGNVISQQKVEIPLGLFRRMFSSYDPKPDAKGRYLTWNFELKPKEQYEIVISTNYRPLLYGLVVIIIFLVIMITHVDRSIVIRKRIVKLKEHDDRIELKVLILARNGKGQALEDVRVVDILPDALALTNEFGTLKPNKVQKGLKSTRLVWDIGKLDPKEERIFTYRVQSKLKFLHGVLPPATLQFLNQKRKLITIRSTRLNIGKS